MILTTYIHTLFLHIIYRQMREKIRFWRKKQKKSIFLSHKACVYNKILVLLQLN